MQTLVEKMHDLVYKSGCTLYTDYDTATPLGFGGFKEGRVMAVAGYLANAYVTLRDTDIDFGLIPFPKFDEQQDGYKSYVMATNGVICVGKSATDTDRTGILVEAFAAETYKQVIPIYYDVALTNKYLRDEGSVDMLDIIRGGIVYDFGFVYDNWMGCTWILPNMMKEKQTSVEAYWAGIESKVSAWYESLYEAAADYSLD